MEVDKAKIYSISEFVGLLNADLKWMKAKIVGEVGEAKAGPTGCGASKLSDSERRWISSAREELALEQLSHARRSRALSLAASMSSVSS